MTAVKTATNNPNHLLHVSDITLNMLQWHRHDRLTLTLVLSYHTHTHTHVQNGVFLPLWSVKLQ